ncbi:MAG TPA: cell division protein ZapA [Allosphingosinicella sp.]|jgi:cell division protein ZapA
MASVSVEIASRTYAIACREGEQEHFRTIAAIVDEKAQSAAAALGNLTEARQLLFASLLLADELREKRKSDGAAPAMAEDSGIADALERLATRIERLADGLEGGAQTP